MEGHWSFGKQEDGALLDEHTMPGRPLAHGHGGTGLFYREDGRCFGQIDFALLFSIFMRTTQNANRSYAVVSHIGYMLYVNALLPMANGMAINTRQASPVQAGEGKEGRQGRECGFIERP